jgi:thioredoxin reductase (NADPH)
MYDTIIIGKGPAGITCAIYLKRAGVNPLVIGKDGGALAKSEKIENYYGFAEPVSAGKLLGDGIKQAENLGVEVIEDEVVGIEAFDTIKVTTLEKEYSAKTLLLATGKKRIAAPVKGLKDFEGRGVSFCALCDGFFYKGKSVAVLGGGKYALSEAAFLKNIAAGVKIFSNGEAEDLLRQTFPQILIEDKVIEIYGGEKAEGIRTEKGEYPVEGIFIALGSAGSAEFAATMGLETDSTGSIVVDGSYSTNIKGVFAAGDCVGGMSQIVKAAYQGAAAAQSIIKYLKQK